MAKTNLTARPTGAPTTTPAERDDDLITEGDDEREEEAPAAPSTPAPVDPGEELFAAAKRKLGLPPNASPLDLLKAIAGSAAVRPSGPPRAACSLVLDVGGKRVVLAEGDMIPKSVDLAALERCHPHAIKRG